MSFIKIVDVILNSGQRNRLGGPSSLTGNGRYDSNTYRFPIDIGSFDKGHYILFHVNEQTTTQFPGRPGPDDPVILQNLKNLQERRGAVNFSQSAGQISGSFPEAQKYGAEISSAAGGLASSLLGNFAENKIIKGITNITGGAVGGISSAASSLLKNEGFVRKIRRTTDTVALYMPDTMQFGYSQTYADVSMSSSVLQQGASAATAAINGEKVSMEQAGRNLSPFIMNLVAQKAGPEARAIFTAATGLVQNPMLEVIYTSPKMRSFSFTFAFYPRSEAEALEVQKILDRFRFHSSPEIKKNTGGMFLIPPSEFDIKFMYNGKENPNIDKISTCVLTDMSVDYAKTGGFTAYEVEGEGNPALGRTGMPVGIGLTLTFMETQILTKEYYNPGGAVGEVNRLGGSVQDFLTGSNGFGNYGE
jgi:hypothetical protein